MPIRRRTYRPKARTALFWAVAVFVCLQGLLVCLMDGYVPELRDPEYGYKLAQLRVRLTKDPGRPLLLVLGSSRAGLGIRPDVIAETYLASARAPMVFNFAITGSGPLAELLCLRRLLADGIRPDQVVIEVLPPLLHQEDPWAEVNTFDINRLTWRDCLLWREYSHEPWSLAGRWLRSRLTPWFTHRFCIMSRYAPCWLAWDCRQDGWRGIDRWGWVHYARESVDAREYERGLALARLQYTPLLDHFHLSERPDRALRELLDLCRQRDIASLLLLMPEGRVFQSFYPPGSHQAIDSFLSGLGREYGIPVIDARDWMPETAFFDSHHLLPHGAAAFTQQLTRDVLRPYLDGKAIAAAPYSPTAEE